MSILDNYDVSYAQNREDVIIQAFFADIKNGFYVDVGANDPVDDSVTMKFYEKGWHGINIEPNQYLHARLQMLRKRDINLRIGIADKPGKLMLRQYTNHGLSTFSKEQQKEYVGKVSDKTNAYDDVEVPVSTLNHVFQENNVSKVDFLKVDVEGFEYEVLKGLDWGRYHPTLVCVESNHIKQDWRELLKKNGYLLVFFDGLNDYYLHHSEKKRQKLFDYSEVLLLGKPIISPGIAKNLTMLESTVAINDNLKTKLVELEDKYDQALNQRNELFRQLEEYSGLKRQLKKMISTFYVRLYQKLEEMGRSSKLAYPKRDIAIADKENFSEILVAIQSYDSKVFTESRLNGSIVRRVMSLSLLQALVFIKRMAKLLVRILRRTKRL